MQSKTPARLLESGKSRCYRDCHIPVAVEAEEDARADVAVGELAYWPMGSAFCIFFGPTPVSTGTEPRAYSPVNVFGRIEGDTAVLRSVPDGPPIRVFKI